MPFTEAQARHLVATFKYMDKSLLSALRAVSGETNDLVLVREYELDSTSAQTAALAIQIANFRTLLREFLQCQQIAMTPPASAILTFKTTLEFVRMAIQEIDPQGLANFGKLSPEGSIEITRLIEDLSKIITRMMTICHERHGYTLE